MADDSRQTAGEQETQQQPIWYDYTLQAWIQDGRVARCGHVGIVPDCYACLHAGQEADPTHYTLDY